MLACVCVYPSQVSSFQMTDPLQVVWWMMNDVTRRHSFGTGDVSWAMQPLVSGQSVFWHLIEEDHWDVMWSAVKCVRDVCCRELLQMFGREESVWFPIGYVSVCDVLGGSGSHVCVCKEMREWERGVCLLMHLCLCLSEGISLELHGSLLKDCSLCVYSESLALHLTLLTAQSRGKGSPSIPDTSHIHFAVLLLRNKIPHLSHWSHDSVCLSTCLFPRGSSGLPWGWGS